MGFSMKALLVLIPVLCALLSAASAEEPQYQSAPVVVANRTVVVLRGPIAGYTAEERARGSMQRIEDILKSNPNPEISFEDYEENIGATRIKLGGKHAFLITPIDIDKQAGETTQIVAQEAGKRLQQAIAEWREQNSPRQLALDAALAAAATLVYAAILWLLHRGSRWLGN